MARIHGRFGRIYLGSTSTAAAEPVFGTTSWTVNSQTDYVDATAQGDTSKQNLAGLPGSDFTFDSIYSDSEYTGNVFTAALDGLARKIYMYPNASDNTKYLMGTAFVSGSITSSVSDKTSVSGKGAFASNMVPIGIS